MFELVLTTFRALVFPERVKELALENLALRQQLAVMKRQCRRPRLRRADRWFWVWLLRAWPNWRRALLLVRPETVVGWHRQGFRLFWTWISRRKRSGRPGMNRELWDLVRKMAEANPLWGAPRIHGELLKLGIEISERTVPAPSCKRSRCGAEQGTHSRNWFQRNTHRPKCADVCQPNPENKAFTAQLAVKTSRLVHLSRPHHPKPRLPRSFRSSNQLFNLSVRYAG